MSRLSGRFTQAPEERRRYILNYTLTLSEGEFVTSMAVPVITRTFPQGAAPVTPLVIDSVVIGPTPFTSVIFYASGGDDNTVFEVQFLATTSTGQIIEDVIEFSIESDT
jgi:hypothetical protein